MAGDNRKRKNLMTEQIKKLGKGVQLAEEQGDKKLVQGLLADAFRGRASFEHIFPWPGRPHESTQNAEEVLEDLDKFLSSVDIEFTEESRDIPLEKIKEMADLGFFRLKIPKEKWGGRGLDQTGYIRAISYLTSYYGPAAIMVSADNTIGCKFPLLKYGTEEQKEKYLPELTKWPSGFCFTEVNVGSDPARMETYALRVKEGDKTVGYRITGKKQYTTNSAISDNFPLAENLSVVVRIVDDPNEIQAEKDVKKFCFGLFIVPTSSKGLSVGERIDLGPRNEFSGMRGIFNANPEFENVWVRPIQLIGGEGNGFRIALQALNTGRIAIASSCVAISKQCHDGSVNYAENRVQWGGPIIEKELIGVDMLARGLCNIFAFDSMTQYAAIRSDNGQDARLEATMAKVGSSEDMWAIVDNTMQILGGIGYETTRSSSRRKKVFPAERFFRDARPNRIFEGSTQILSQWAVGEGMKFLKPFAQMGLWREKGLIVLELIKNRIGHTDIPRIPKAIEGHILNGHLKFFVRRVEKFSNRVLFFVTRDAIRMFMKRVGFKINEPSLIDDQLTLWRLFWINYYLGAMAVSCARAVNTNTESAVELADGFCSGARIIVDDLFRKLFRNNDKTMRSIYKKMRKGEYDWFVYSDIVPITKKLNL